MKRIIAHLVVALCVLSSVRADQTTQSVQQALTDQGFYYGNVTGEKSAETTAAIRRYQIRNGLQVTGEINPETLRSLNLGASSASSFQPASKSAVTQSSNVRPHESSLFDQNPSSSRPPSEPGRRLEINPAFSGAPYQSAPPRMSGRLVVAEVQRQLASRGYYRGRVDGRHGRRTALALRDFQLQSGLPPTGHLDTSTLNALGLSDANLAYLEPTPRHNEAWVPIMKFKHGKWKVKWKKYHHGHGDEDEEWNGDGRWHGEDHDD
jgi:peptidoglycan hydrolase-like protein with peptidoglycan-binding domain